MPVWINRSTGKFQGRELLTVGAMADSYYEYLLKTWLYTRKQVRQTCVLDTRKGVTGWPSGRTNVSSGPTQ